MGAGRVENGVAGGGRARRILTERWGLQALPWVAVGELPTPVERLVEASRDTGADLWCKRDDLTALPYGGNKVRKLEWLIGEARARGCGAIVTTGAIGSHHVLATALYGRAHGLEVHAVMLPQPWTDHVETQLRADLKAGARLYPARSYLEVAARMALVSARLRARGVGAHVVGPGGSSPVGALGYVEAGLELAAQVDAGALPEPDAVYVAAGSGGTAAGLAVGLAAAGLTTRVVAVRVIDRLAINRALLSRLVRKTTASLRRLDPRFPAVAPEAMRNLVIDASQLGSGYGASTPESEAATAAAAADGLVLDPTYTAKAFAAALADARAGKARRPLFWQTLSSAPLDVLAAGAPDLPDWARKLALRARSRRSR